jgi:hypothetical protein
VGMLEEVEEEGMRRACHLAFPAAAVEGMAHHSNRVEAAAAEEEEEEEKEGTHTPVAMVEEGCDCIGIRHRHHRAAGIHRRHREVTPVVPANSLDPACHGQDRC